MTVPVRLAAIPAAEVRNAPDPPVRVATGDVLPAGTIPSERLVAVTSRPVLVRVKVRSPVIVLPSAVSCSPVPVTRAYDVVPEAS